MKAVSRRASPESRQKGAGGCIGDALRTLERLGIQLTLAEKSVKDIASSGCDRRTLPQSLVLAQILFENQPITVRGAFYRAVSAGIYADTAAVHYRQVCNIVLKLRRAGLVPYRWIADSTRIRRKPSSWSGLNDYAETVRSAYRRDFWASQADYIETAVEKDAMCGVVAPVTDEFDLHLNVIRGNASETFVFNMAESLSQISKPIHIYYLGDHDPNGLDIERDFRRRLSGFLDREIHWRRLAITPDDFARTDLLGFPVKASAGSKAWTRRAAEYQDRFGDRCVEVDAVPPDEIRARIRAAIVAHIDQEGWQKARQIEELERDTINQALAGGLQLGGVA